MSSASPQVVEYLLRQLSRNPIHESAEIIAMRAQAFELKATAPPAVPSASPAGQRQQVKAQLDNIRNQCFSAPIDPLINQLGQLPLADYPDLAALGKRLQVILESRSKLPALSANKRFDGDFFRCLKKVLVSPSRDVSVLREQVLSSFRQRKIRLRGQAMVRLIRDELPELYAMEADWLGSLLKYRLGNYSAVITAGSGNNSDSVAIAGWLAVVITAGLIGAIVASRDDGKSPRSGRQPPRVAPLPRVPMDIASEHNLTSDAEKRLRAQMDRSEQFRFESQQRLEELRRKHLPPANDFDRRPGINGAPSDLRGGFARPRVVPVPSGPRNFDNAPMSPQPGIARP